MTPNLAPLVAEIRELIEMARSAAHRQVNTLVVLTNFEVGRRIVHHEQGGEVRAEYGKEVLKTLSEALTAEFGRGWSVSNLTLMRRFYLAYADRLQKSQTPSTISGHSEVVPISQTPSANFVELLFALSWSHYVFLIGVSDPDERAFYEAEAASNGWSLAELRRQFDTSLYERLALSRDKEGVQALAREGLVVTTPGDVLKDPYVLEFLGLEEHPRYSESDLETRIIDKLEHFLLELGKGFLFEGRHVTIADPRYPEQRARNQIDPRPMTC